MMVKKYGLLLFVVFVVGMLYVSIIIDSNNTMCVHKHINTTLITVDGSKSPSLATSGKLFTMNEKIRYFQEIPVDNYVLDALPPNSYPMSSKWAVISTIFSPTKVVKTLSGMTDWCTVIVCDIKSIDSERYLEELDLQGGSCVVYLDVDSQQRLGYEILDYIGFNTFARKNIGYLFAIQHGARVIYDTDDDNEISDPVLLDQWLREDWTHVSQWKEVGSNPYPSYGMDGVWPRGIPLTDIKNHTSFYSLHLGVQKGHDVCIVQSLANSEPDVDAIYRLTNKNYPLNFQSDEVHACLVRKDCVTPFNAQATLFFEDAFPYLLLPVTVHGRVSDIWRAYMAQATMSCFLVISTPWVTQVRNNHDYLADFEAEIPLYLQASAFVAFLVAKKRKYDSLLDAMKEAYEYGIVEKADIGLASAWHHDLLRLKFLKNQHSLIQTSSGREGLSSKHNIFNAEPVLMDLTPAYPVSSPEKVKKTLVILIGNARGGEIAWKSLQKNVLAPLHADLATLFTPQSQSNYLMNISRYTWTIPEFDDWRTFYQQESDLHCGTGNNWNAYCSIGGIFLGGISNCGSNAGSGGILLAFRWKLHDLLTEHRLWDKYTHFVLTRSDHLYLCPHPIINDTGFLWMPEGEDYGGIVDRHMVAESSLFARAINLRNEFLCKPQESLKMIENIGEVNIETFLAKFFSSQNLPIRRFPRNMFAIKLQSDPTRWSTGVDDPRTKGAFFVKYPNELNMAEATCGIQLIDQDLRLFF